MCVAITSGCSLVKYTVDHAPYSVLESNDHIEIRYYRQLLLVTTAMPEAMQDLDEKSDDSAFRRLFRYISGENEESQNISMTAPVFMDKNRKEKMSFVLPDDFSKASAPLPLDSSLKLEEMSNAAFAVIRFNGRLDRETVELKLEELNKWMAKRGLVSQGSAIIAGYDPPSALPWFRRNEVLIPITWPNA